MSTAQTSAFYRKRVQTNRKRKEALVNNYIKSLKKLNHNIRLYSSKLKTALVREENIRGIVKKASEFFDINFFRGENTKLRMLYRDMLFKYALENRISGGAISLYFKMDVLTAAKRRRILNRRIKEDTSVRELNVKFVLFMKN